MKYKSNYRTIKTQTNPVNVMWRNRAVLQVGSARCCVSVAERMCLHLTVFTCCHLIPSILRLTDGFVYQFTFILCIGDRFTWCVNPDALQRYRGKAPRCSGSAREAPPALPRRRVGPRTLACGCPPSSDGGARDASASEQGHLCGPPSGRPSDLCRARF